MRLTSAALAALLIAAVYVALGLARGLDALIERKK